MGQFKLVVCQLLSIIGTGVKRNVPHWTGFYKQIFLNISKFVHILNIIAEINNSHWN